MKRPRLPNMGFRRRSAVRAPDAAALPSLPRTEDDAHILRRTRLRLMAVSGAVTLVILVLLGAAVYTVTANALASDSTARLERVASDYARDRTSPRTEAPYGLTFGGDRAGIVPIVLDKDGNGLAGWPKNQTMIGLPDTTGLRAALAGGTDLRTAVVTTTILTPAGTVSQQVEVRVYSVPIRDASGAIVGALQVCADRTEEVQLLGTLFLVLILGGLLAMLAALLAGYLYAGRALVPIRQSIDRRQAALQRQREFAANASHELRTPLTVISASVEDLKRNQNSKVRDVGEALGDIEAEARHMTALVEDMLLLARTDSGVLQVERIPMDLADVAADVAGSLTTLGQERGVSVLLDPSAPVTGDPLRLRQLVTILADNAIRHSRKGSTVIVRVRPDSGAAVVQVEDEGPGIKPDDLPRLFERFWRADDAPAGGTGLGLAIAKWIVDQHGGTIAAEDRAEGGAKFTVRLPSGNSAAQPTGLAE